MVFWFCASSRAQIVNDGATNTLSDVTNSIPGGLTVGTNGWRRAKPAQFFRLRLP